MFIPWFLENILRVITLMKLLQKLFHVLAVFHISRPSLADCVVGGGGKDVFDKDSRHVWAGAYRRHVWFTVWELVNVCGWGAGGSSSSDGFIP